MPPPVFWQRYSLGESGRMEIKALARFLFPALGPYFLPDRGRSWLRPRQIAFPVFAAEPFDKAETGSYHLSRF